MIYGKTGSKGIVIFSWASIVLGAIGSVFFLASADILLRSLYYIETRIPDVYTIGIDFRVFDTGFLYCLMTAPYPLIFFLGIGMRGLKLWARAIIMGLPPIVSANGYFFVHVNMAILKRPIHWQAFLTLFIPLMILCLVAAYFFSRPKVKAQFA